MSSCQAHDFAPFKRSVGLEYNRVELEDDHGDVACLCGSGCAQVDCAAVVSDVGFDSCFLANDPDIFFFKKSKWW